MWDQSGAHGQGVNARCDSPTCRTLLRAWVGWDQWSTRLVKSWKTNQKCMFRFYGFAPVGHGTLFLILDWFANEMLKSIKKFHISTQLEVFSSNYYNWRGFLLLLLLLLFCLFFNICPAWYPPIMNLLAHVRERSSFLEAKILKISKDLRSARFLWLRHWCKKHESLSD